MNNGIPELKIGNLVAKMPIIQGGMGVGISMAGLVSAVANEGGVGVISTVGIGLLEPGFKKYPKRTNKEALVKEIRKAKKSTSGIIGLNIMVALSDFDETVKIALQEKVDVIFLGAGLPLKLPNNITLEELRKSRLKVFPIVSSARAVKVIFQSWAKKFNRIPDGIVVEGPMAGGHLGFKFDQIKDPLYSLETILAEVIRVKNEFALKFNKSIPVIVGGGIYNGVDIKKFLNLGANGVQMGTRFVATKECDASEEFKDLYIKCKKEDIVIIKSPLGLFGRAINNKFLQDVASGLKKPFACPWKCLKVCDFTKAPYCIGLALTSAKMGIFKNGFAFAGENAYRIKEIISVRELIQSLVKEYQLSV